jgi:hypothetical protein
MRVREAKDFLVQQTTEQAQLEGVQLSDLEKRMMYFTETGEMPEDFIQLNEEFEAQYNSDEYEAKIAKLLRHAYQRARKENDETRKHFDAAIKSLRRGDHYLLVMWDCSGSEEWTVAYALRILAGSLGVIVLMFGVVFAVEKFEPQWRWVGAHIPAPNPHLLFAIFLILVATGFLFPSQMSRLGGWLLDKVIEPFASKDKPDES